MKSSTVLTIILLLIVVHVTLITCLDTVFAKGGTCMYKIYNQYNVCLALQQERLDSEALSLPRTISLDEQQKALQRIACCAYWDFLSCVEKAANERCKEKFDMERYTEQLGSAIPLYICREEFPRGSLICTYSSYYSSSNYIIVSFIVPIMLLFHFLYYKLEYEL